MLGVVDGLDGGVAETVGVDGAAGVLAVGTAGFEGVVGETGVPVGAAAVHTTNDQSDVLKTTTTTITTTNLYQKCLTTELGLN